MKTYGGGGIAICTLALDQGKWSVSHLRHFIPREGDPGAPWIGGWLDPKAGLDMVAKRKYPFNM